MPEEISSSDEQSGIPARDLIPLRLPGREENIPTAGAWLLRIIIALGVAIGLILVLGIIWQSIIAIWFPKEDLSAVVRNVGLVVAAIVGLPFLIWRTWNLQRQTNIAQESHYTDLFTKAIEQLGAGKRSKELDEPDEWGRTTAPSEEGLELRLGAIYALERIARESRKDHWPIMEVLCAFIRSNPVKAVTAEKPNDPFQKSDAEQQTTDLDLWVKSLPPPTLDIQAALDVIGRRTSLQLSWEEEDRKNGLDRALNLSRANLQRASLHNAQLGHAILGLSHCEGAGLVEANIDASNFIGASCERTSFWQASCRGARFNRAKCASAVFTRAQAANSSFSRADCRAARFQRAKCHGIWLGNARCDATNFNGAELGRAYMRIASFFTADLSEADLSNVEKLEQDQLDASFGNVDTDLPESLDRPDFWPASRVTFSHLPEWSAAVTALEPPFTREKIGAWFPGLYDLEDSPDEEVLK